MTHRKIIFNSFSNVMKLVSYLIVSFFMTPFLVHNLGVMLYGIWAMVLSVVGYMTLMDLGMQTAVMKYIAECDMGKDKEKISQIILNSLIFYGFITIVGFIILVILAWGGISILKIDPNYKKIIQLVLLIMGIDMLMVFPGTVFQGVLTGMQLFYITNSISIIILLFKTCIVYLVISKGGGIIGLALISLFGNLFEYIIIFILMSILNY